MKDRPLANHASSGYRDTSYCARALSRVARSFTPPIVDTNDGPGSAAIRDTLQSAEGDGAQGDSQGPGGNTRRQCPILLHCEVLGTYLQSYRLKDRRR